MNEHMEHLTDSVTMTTTHHDNGDVTVTFNPS